MAISTGAAILGAAGIGALGSIFSGSQQASAASSAANAQAQGLDAATAIQQAQLELQRQMYEQGRQDYQTGISQGQNALLAAYGGGDYGYGYDISEPQMTTAEPNQNYLAQTAATTGTPTTATAGYPQIMVQDASGNGVLVDMPAWAQAQYDAGVSLTDISKAANMNLTSGSIPAMPNLTSNYLNALQQYSNAQQYGYGTATTTPAASQAAATTTGTGSDAYTWPTTLSGGSGAIDEVLAAHDAGLQAYQDAGLPEAGIEAYQRYGDLTLDPTQYQADPGYQFLQQQGEQALLRQQAATGNLMSGATGKALTEYGQGLASTGLDNTLARYAALGSLGVDQYGNMEKARAEDLSNLLLRRGESLANLATGQGLTLSDMGNQYAGQASATNNALAAMQMQLGNTQAAGTINQTNAYTNALNNLSNLAGQGMMLYGLGAFGNPTSTSLYGSLGNYGNSNALTGSLWGG